MLRRATYSGNIFTLTFANSIQAQVRVVNNTDYLSLELIALTNPNNKDIRAAMWGPYETTIGEQVADVVGIAYSRDFASASRRSMRRPSPARPMSLLITTTFPASGQPIGR